MAYEIVSIHGYNGTRTPQSKELGRIAKGMMTDREEDVPGQSLEISVGPVSNAPDRSQLLITGRGQRDSADCESNSDAATNTNNDDTNQPAAADVHRIDG
jgi:hypothetical protein